MTPLLNTFTVRAAQNVDNMARGKALVDPINCGQQLLGGDAGIKRAGWVQAYITVAAIFFAAVDLLTEVREQMMTATMNGFA